MKSASASCVLFPAQKENRNDDCIQWFRGSTGIVQEPRKQEPIICLRSFLLTSTLRPSRGVGVGSKIFFMDRYRSGHNGAVLKTAVRASARGFEPHPIRHRQVIRLLAIEKTLMTNGRIRYDTIRASTPHPLVQKLSFGEVANA